MESNSKFLLWGLCLLVFMPIVLLPPTFQPATWSRTILFRTILTVLACFLLYKFFYKKEFSFSVPKWEFSKYLSFLALSAFFAVIILSVIFSQDINFSIFGSPSRGGGALNLLFFFVFTVALALFTNENIWQKLFSSLFLVGILCSLLAIVQYFNILKNVFISFESGGTPSFLGNATFLAIYTIFLVFLSFTLFVKEKIKKKKIIYGLLFLLFIFTILITGSRATYLGLLAGFFFFFFFYPKKFKSLKTISASILLLAFLAVLLFNFFPQITEKNTLLKLTAQRLSVKGVLSDLAGTRFSAWKITLKAIKEKPILGWGPENFYMGFEKYYDPTIKDVKNLWWDRPHNAFLEIWVNSGILALLFYVSFWILLLWQLQKFKRQTGDSPNTYLAHGLQTMFVAYLVALFFNFDDFSTYLISFFFIGCSFYLLSLPAEKIVILPPKTNAGKNKFVYIPLLIFLIFFIWFWNIKPLYLNNNIVYADNLISARKCQKALDIMGKTWPNSGILKSYAGLKYFDSIKKCISAFPEKQEEYALSGVNALKPASVIQPRYTRTWIALGAFTNVLAAQKEDAKSKKELTSEAVGYLNKALESSPKRQEILIEMEKSHLLAEDYQAMKQTANDCIKIDDSNGYCYWYLGVAEVFLGDQENGKKHVEEAKQKTDTSYPYIQLGVAYISQKNYKDAADAYYMATVFNDVNNAGYRAVLAYLYRQIGEYSKAAKEAIKVFELQPENKEVPEFLKQLLGLSPNDPTLHSSLAFVYNQIGETEKARQEYLITKSLYEQAVARYPNEGAYHFSLAGVCKELGEYEKAYYEAVLAEKLDPSIHTHVANFISSLGQDYAEKYIKNYSE